MHVRLDDVVERDRPLYAIGGVHCTLLHRLSLLAGFLFLLGEGTVLSFSGDINSFAARYRVSGHPYMAPSACLGIIGSVGRTSASGATSFSSKQTEG